MKTKILTVDDSATIRNMLLITLTGSGFEVIQAADGIDGLGALAETQPDVLITDINMPRLDGFGLIERVRRDDRYRAIPILVLTTESAADKRERARKAGATGWITKPFEPTKLLDAIARVTA